MDTMTPRRTATPPSGAVQSLLPFRGEFGELLNLEALGEQNDAGRGGPLLVALLKDPHLAALDRDLAFAQAIRGARDGSFDEGAFLDEGRRAVARYVRRAAGELSAIFTRNTDVRQLLQQKLVCVASALAPRPSRPARPLEPSGEVQAIFGRRAFPLAMTPVHRTQLLRIDGAFPGQGRYAWRLSTPADEPGASAGTARPEVGRAVFVDDVEIDPVTGDVDRTGTRRRTGRIRTQVVVKGVGPTQYASNRFSVRRSGVLTMLQGERDWQHAARLARGGVPVYRPLELTLLPYCHWHPRLGWRPMVVYARLPMENLRVSDLDLLAGRHGRDVIAALRAKLSVMAGEAGEGVDAALLIRFVVARLGRIAGLCESGRTFDGEPFFHGFLHPQNVSLLGELVDLGEGRFVTGRGALTSAYARSGYLNPEKAWAPCVRRSRRERILFHQIARLFARRVARFVTPPAARAAGGLDLLFWQAHREGCAGRPADDARELLERIGRGRGAA